MLTSRSRHQSSKSQVTTLSRMTRPGGGTGSGRSSVIKKRGSISESAQDGSTEQHGHSRAIQVQTIKFTYSDAVSRAFRRKYKAPQFGPPSATAVNIPGKKLERDPTFVVSRLPELYSDFQLITDLIESNRTFAARLRTSEEQAADDFDDASLNPSGNHKRGVTKFPRLGQQRMRARGGNTPSSSVPTLPSIPQVSTSRGGDGGSKETSRTVRE